MGATPHQQWAHDMIIGFFKSGAQRAKLKGSAGTGKTWLSGEIIKTLKKGYDINLQYNNGLVYVTAPTNKALAVLKGKVDSQVEFATIHSALKLRKWTDSKTGIEVFAPNFGSGRNEFKNAKAAVIDEASMLGIGIEGGYIMEDTGNGMERVYKRGHLDGLGFPILYIGDPKQINPVGEEESAVWLKDYPEVELTEIIRQGNGNPIITLSRDIDLLFSKEPNIIDGKGYVYDNNRMGFIESLAEANGTDELKYLAWTNSDVDDMNRFVRKRIYGDHPSKIERGETLVFDSPIDGYYTNQEVKIRDVEIVTADVPVPNSKTRFDGSNKPINDTDKLRVKYYRINDSFNVVHEDSDTIYNNVFNILASNCSKHGWDFKGKSFFKDQFAQTKYNHAITVHKSQGSTYKTTIINIGNIMFNKNAPERERLLYTAITRASDLVILNNVK